MRLALALFALMPMLPTSVHAQDDWHFLVAPYVWFAGVKGDLSVVPNTPASAVDVSPVEALKDTEISFMLLLEAKKRRHGVLFDVFYSDVLQKEQTNTGNGLNWKASMKNTMLSSGYTYEVYRSPHTVIDVIGGLRYWEFDTQLTVRSGSGSSKVENIHNSKAWIDPMTGVDAKFRLGNSPVYLAGFLAAGGASGGSEYFYDLSANLGYQIREGVFASVGYRMFDVDYEDDSVTFDVKQEGWVLGLVWVFGTNKLGND